MRKFTDFRRREIPWSQLTSDISFAAESGGTRVDFQMVGRRFHQVPRSWHAERTPASALYVHPPVSRMPSPSRHHPLPR